MTPHRFTCAALIPILGIGFLIFYPVSAQITIPGGGNSNPSTNPGPPHPEDPDKPSEEDGNGPPSPPPEPPPELAEGKSSCEDDQDPDDSAPEDGPPGAPGSVDLSFSLEACPLEYSVAVGGMRLYFEKAEDNMGDPIHLEYNSVAGAKILPPPALPLAGPEGPPPVSLPSPLDLPPGVVKRYMIAQVSGKPLAFDLFSGNPVMKPSGSGAASNARAELRTASGAITSDLALATRLRQYRSAGGYMEFALPAGNILKWAGPTGRSLDFPVDPATGTAGMGLEVLKDGDRVRQVKSPAGMLDVVADFDGRGYRVVTYLPSEVGPKTGNFYTLVSNARPSKTVHIVHPLGTLKLVAVFTDHSPDGNQDRIRTLTYTYIQTFDGGHEWDMMTEADGMTLKSTRHVVPDNDKPGMRRVVREVTDGSGNLLTRKEVIQQFEAAWNGWTDVQDIETPGGDVTLRKVQSYRYGTNPADSDFRKRNWQMTETGRVYEFKYDSEGRMIERRSPWLDGAGGMLLIEKYAYAPHGPGEVVLPGDGRPRTKTTEVGIAGASGNAMISKSYFAAYNDAANGGRHTVINEDAATPSGAFGSATNRRKKQVFFGAGAGVESGRVMETTDENGLRTQFTYAARAGGGYTETMMGPLDASAFAKAGVTRRRITQKDGFNRILTIREALYDGSAYVDFQEDLNVYSPQGQLANVFRTDLKSNRQRLLSSYQWRGDQMVALTAEDGSVRGASWDGFDRLVGSTQAAIPSSSSPITDGLTYPARPGITRTTSGTMIADMERADWGHRSVTTTAGSLTLVETAKADARGRITEETDVDGYTSGSTHLRNGLEMNVTRPDGGTVNTLYYLDGRIKQRIGTGLVPEYYSYTANAAGGLTTTLRLGSANGSRYQSTTVDILGRIVNQGIPGHGGAISIATTYIGGTSRVSKVVSSAPQTAAKVFEYDTFASPTRQGETVRSGATVLDPSSSNDRIQDSEVMLLNDTSGLWEVRKKFIYPNEGATAATRYLLTESRSKIAGFTGDETQRSYSVDSLGNWQMQVTDERVADQVRIERNTSNAFAGESVSIYHGGLMVEQRRPSDTVSTRTGYDSLGRLISTKQPHHLHADAILYALGGNQVISRTDANGAVTSYEYFPQGSTGAGRVATVTEADLKVRRSAYDLRGNMTRTWGSATAPTAYGFDGYNQLETLSTYRTDMTGDSASWPTTIGTADLTTWIREDSTGLIIQKKHADNLGPIYEYDIAGKVTRRTWARGLVTDYTYTAWGQPDVTNYADATPDADADYDRIGRKTRESNGVATSDFQYSPTTLRPTLETISYDLDANGTPELTRQLDRGHDNLRRPTGFTLKDGTTLENQATYGYDAYSRLDSVKRTGVAPVLFSYSYIQNSSLLYQVMGPSHTITNTWEPDRDVLDVKENKAGSTIVSKFDYTVNAIGQRTGISQTGTAFASVRSIAWGYDFYGQITSADSTTTGQDRAYQYDAMGNRKKSATSLTLPITDNYTANSLNQYSVIQEGGAGVSPVYDVDGNATTYPLPVAPNMNSILVWDSENHQIASTVNGNTTNYLYDSNSRRIAKTTNGTSTLYIYDVWNCIAEYTRSVPGSSPSLSKTNLWGTDLSGSLQSAGGVGGLLSVTIGNTIHFPTYDGNGNVSEYLSSTGSIGAHFEYDPFGNTTVNTDVENQFTHKFSTKPQDGETGLYYYGYRHYDPISGRWLSRDPIDERGGLNLYGMIGNDMVQRWDYLGLQMPSPSPNQIPISPNLPPNVIPGPGFGNSPIIQPGLPVAVRGAAVAPVVGVAVLGVITIWAGVETLEEIEAAIQSQNALDAATREAERLSKCLAASSAVYAAKEVIKKLGGCNNGDCCATIRIKKAAWLALAAARSVVNVSCYNGGDAGHQQQLADVWVVVANCQRLELSKCK